jgi:hypothetical protein
LERPAVEEIPSPPEPGENWVSAQAPSQERVPGEQLVGDRLPEEFENFRQRLIEVHFFRLIQVPRLTGENQEQHGIIRHARD